jgi:transcriptional regulator with XRE-family HTH domain
MGCLSLPPTIHACDVIAECLRSALERLKMSHAEVALALGVQRRTLCRWLSGETEVSLVDLMRHKVIYRAFLRELVARTGA